MSSVGKPLAHDSARGHVSGEAKFVDDLPRLDGELEVGFVGTPCAAGRIVSIDTAAARALPGVVGCWTAADVGGRNHFGPIFDDEPFLAQTEALYLLQPAVIVAATSRRALERARRAVRIEVEKAAPVLSIEDAHATGAYLGPERRIQRGDAAAAIDTAPHHVEGTLETGGQEQFYFESQAAIAVPGEEGQIVVHSSTQNPTEVQNVVAEVLGVPQHHVVCVCKRMGGAFGGKETQAAIPAAMAALVAQKTGRPARIVYGKDDDMKVTGKRHEYRTRYRAGFDDQGRIRGLEMHFLSNGGAAADLSTSVMERSMLHADNAYFLPAVTITGRVCRTNLPPNTAFRGFGGPQALAAIENVIEEIAAHLGVDALEVRQRNLYGAAPRNVTPYGQLFDENQLPRILAELEESSDYASRRRQIEEANRAAGAEIRGIALTPVKFGISFTTAFLNQGNALVNVYTDGSVQVSTGGTEMGQGLNTKIRQLVADELGIDADRVLVMPTSTEKNHNTSPTAASASTDLNGAAAVEACRQIRERLARFAAERLAGEGGASDPGAIEFRHGRLFDTARPEQAIDFATLCDEARRQRVDLGARGFYATPGVDFDREAGQGTPFFYFTQGAAVCEVAIDRFTGELEVRRADLLLDIGESINPGIDRGQYIGGFLQGLGWVTTEELCYDDKGALLSHSPTTYKIPAVSDLPAILEADFFPNSANRRNVRASKAIGEPPLMLAIAAWAAVKQALQSYAGGPVALRLPATQETILRHLVAIERRRAEARSEPASLASSRA